MKKKILYFLFFGFILFLLLDIYVEISDVSDRVHAIEDRLGGASSLACDEEELKDELSKKIVRIIGVYGEGTGFPINNSQIITSFHVIDGDTAVKIVFPSGKIEEPKNIVGNKNADIAIIDILTAEYLEPFDLPDKEIKFGEPVYAAGYALGSNLPGDITVSKGIYTGTRFVDELDIRTIQSDISLIGGMSGGPLVSACGEIIGINTSGVTGLSLFMDYATASKNFEKFTDEDIEKIEIDTSTPLGVVEAFYSHIRTKDLGKAYRLVTSEKLDNKPYNEWRKGYENTLYVEIIDIKEDEQDENKIYVKFESGDWVDGELVIKYFEGYWIVNEDLKLHESNIKHIEDPGWEWFWEWEE